MKKLLLLMLALAAIPSMSSAVTLDLQGAYGFQDEGVVGFYPGNEIDVTNYLRSVDSVYGTGEFGYAYYATGTSAGWLDAVALDFDLAPLGGTAIESATLMLQAKKGSYSDRTWEHYSVLPGLYNPALQDSAPPAFGIDFFPGIQLPNFAVISNGVDGWYSIALDPTLLGANGELTLRLWNVSLDAVRLDVTAVPEPGTLLLLGSGILGLGLLRRRKQN